MNIDLANMKPKTKINEGRKKKHEEAREQGHTLKKYN
jgi:hypothetical protein